MKTTELTLIDSFNQNVNKISKCKFKHLRLRKNMELLFDEFPKKTNGIQLLLSSRKDEITEEMMYRIAITTPSIGTPLVIAEGEDILSVTDSAVVYIQNRVQMVSNLDINISDLDFSLGRMEYDHTHPFRHLPWE